MSRAPKQTIVTPKINSEKIGIVGLWHLGCTLTAAWSKLGKTVQAIDFDPNIVASLSKGIAPIFEPGINEMLQEGLKEKRISFSTNPNFIKDARFIFLAYDTPVANDDSSEITILEEAIEKIGPHLSPSTMLIISAQLPVGTSSQFRARLKKINPSLELVYSPENLRLGEALDCYLNPGHIVIGSETHDVHQSLSRLFAPMQAELYFMNLASAEMTKHGINAFLATSIVFANQIADICLSVGADFNKVASAMRSDPRIGKKAYLNSGLGFSGGTLGRDLQALSKADCDLGNKKSFFSEIWRSNKNRIKKVSELAKKNLGKLEGKTIALLGMTYKPGTSTLRRSLALEVAGDLIDQGALVRAFDPKADWKNVALPKPFQYFQDAYTAARGAHMAVLLTEWPEFQTIDFQTLLKQMSGNLFLDTKDFLIKQHSRMESLGFRVLKLAGSQPSKEGR